MNEYQADEMLSLMREINDKLDRIISQELRVNADDMQEIKHYVKEIKKSI